MDFVYLQTFCEVARWGNYSRAAEALGYAQSSVTTQIQKLEEQYGARLFERYGRLMQLTQAGKTLLPYARQILALQAEAKTQLTGQQTGSLTIGTIETLAAYYLPPVFQTFRQTHPGINLTMQVGNETSIIKAVKGGHCDLGLILDGFCSDPELVAVPLRKEEFAVVTLPGSPYEFLSQVTAAELAHERFILTEEGCTYRALLLKALEQSNTPYQVPGEFGSLEAIKRWVLNGLGIAFLPRFAVEEDVGSGRLRVVPFECPYDLYTQLIFLERKWPSQAFQALVELLSGLRLD